MAAAFRPRSSVETLQAERLKRQLDLRMSNPFFDHPILNSPYEYPSRHWESTAQGEMARATVPSLLQVFQSMKVTAGPDGEIRIPDSIFDRIAPTDFSRHMLALATDRLLALPLENTGWSDLSDSYRVLVTLLEKHGTLPSWASLWPDPEAAPRTAAASA